MSTDEQKFDNSSLSYDARLLLRVKQGFDLRSDAELARFVGVKRQVISNVNSGRARLSVGARFVLLDKIGYLKFIDAMQDILPSSLAKPFIGVQKKITRLHLSNDSELIDFLKEQLGFKCDEELAEFLEVSRGYISTVRSGRSKLGLMPVLKIMFEGASGAKKDEVGKLLTIIADEMACFDAVDKHLAGV
ncbi:MAG: hypothetical protein ACSHXK_14515 [Oceanococcus sp.]